MVSSQTDVAVVCLEFDASNCLGSSRCDFLRRERCCTRSTRRDLNQTSNLNGFACTTSTHIRCYWPYKVLNGWGSLSPEFLEQQKRKT